MTYTEIWDTITAAPSTTSVSRDADKATIPFDDGNRDYHEYKAWLDVGNTPTPATAPIPPIPTVIGRYQYYSQCAKGGVIPTSEARGAMAGTIPPTFVPLIANVPSAQQFDVEMLLSGGDVFDRTATTCAKWQTAGLGWTRKQTEDFWTAASKLD